MNWANQHSCRICGASTVQVADLGNLALTCVFPRMDEEAPRIPLTVRHCKCCGLLQLGENTNPSLMYAEGYGYKSGINESMVSHLQGIVQEVKLPIIKSVLDIGCNDGTLLRCWQNLNPNLSLTGYDPIAKPIEGMTIIPEYFSADGRKHDVITSIAMFYDLPDPISFARDIAKSLMPGGVWVLECQYAGAIQQGLWDGICHEHLEYYGIRQIQYIAREAGLNIQKVSFNSANGGSFRCHIGFGGQYNIGEIIEKELHWDWSDLWDTIRFSAKNIRKRLNDRRIYALGASTKGNTLLQCAWQNQNTIIAAIERNPEKVGRKTPGSNIPIKSEAWLTEHPPEALLVLPYHFRESILRRYSNLPVKFIFPLPEVSEV